MNVANLNATYPNYPMTVEDKGWVYGVWYCGTAWGKVKLHGQYPPSFLKRALALFPDAKNILHCPSGTLLGPGITIDAIRDAVRCPQIIADASALPLPDASLDLVLSDPPYTKADSKKYGMPPFPLTRFIRECHRTLKPGGHLAMLHSYIPSFRKQDWNIVGLIAVATGVYRMTRMFTILERRQSK